MTQQENNNLETQQADLQKIENQIKKLLKLTELMKQEGLVELGVEHKDVKIFLKLYSPKQIATTQPEPKIASAPSNADFIEIKSETPGTLYMAPSPESKPYVEIGSHVEPETVLCLIEAMKVMSERKAEISGTIIEILGKNGQAVEYGQVLFRIKKD